MTLVSLNPTQKRKFRGEQASYCLRAEVARLNRGYSQRRPGRGYGLEPDADQLDDCSMFCSKVYYFAGHKLHLMVADPLGFRYAYSGYGNTETMQDYLTHEAPLDKYLVGDCALWGHNEWDTTHAAICRKAGTRKTAIFTSHGHQSWNFGKDAPNPISLATYTNEHFIGVFRHPALR